MFRDAADFCVLMLWDMDDFYGHPRLKYLPDSDFAGMVLTFDVEYTNLWPLDSPKSPPIDFPYLDVIRTDGSTAQIPLAANATTTGGSAASAVLTVVGPAPAQFDRVTLWYQDFAYDFIVPGTRSVTMTYFGGTGGKVHKLVIGSNTYSFTEAGGGSSGNDIAMGLQTAATGDANGLATAVSNTVVVTPATSAGGTVSVGDDGTDGNGTGTLWIALHPETTVSAYLANAINATSWGSTILPLSATAAGADAGTVDTAGTAVTWVSGTKFGAALVAAVAAGPVTITIAGVGYTISSVTDSTHLVLTTPAGPQTGAAYTDSLGAGLTVSCTVPGVDGNSIVLYQLNKTTTLKITPSVAPLKGGTSPVWSVSIDFTALGIDSPRQMWLTFAPALTNGTAYPANPWAPGVVRAFGDIVADPNGHAQVCIVPGTSGPSTPAWNDSGGITTDGMTVQWGDEGALSQWSAVFSNWAVSDPSSHRALSVAGPGSVRVEDSDSWCSYQGGGWSLTPVGFYSKGFARVNSTIGDSVTVEYWCSSVHDLWIGTSLYSNYGKWGVSLDGGAEVSVDCYLDAGTPVVTRRRSHIAVSAGHHVAVLTVRAKNSGSGGNACYFDFLEAVIASAVPDAPGPYATSSPAIDYDTTHGYTLPPARLLWMFGKLGFTGPFNEYMGVFWWNQRAAGADVVIPQAVVTSAGTWAAADVATLTISGVAISKTVFPADTLDTIAAHFAYYINEIFSGIWASAAGAVLTITNRSPGAAYSFGLTVSNGGSVAGTVVVTSGSLTGGVVGTWVIDPTQSPALNAGAAAWHADLFVEVHAAGGTIVSSLSMELVDTPDTIGDVWAARFPDGSVVETATGFGSCYSRRAMRAGRGELSGLSEGGISATRIAAECRGADTGAAVR